MDIIRTNTRIDFMGRRRLGADSLRDSDSW